MTIVHLPPLPALVLNTKGKPPIPDWIPPPETKEDLPWASLHTLDLSMLDSPDPAVVAELQATCKEAILQDGFLYVNNFGITHEQLLMQFAPAQFCLVGEGMTDSERERLTWKPETSFAVYKPRIGWGEMSCLLTPAVGKLQEQRTIHQNRRDVGDIERSGAHLGTHVNQHEHHHIHETVQPVVQRETIQPTTVHHTIPVSEKIQEAPIVHEATNLSAISHEQFLQQKHAGSPLRHSDKGHTHQFYEGAPGVGGAKEQNA